MSLFTELICHPPLGQTTVIPGSQKSIFFTVIVKASKSLPEVPWEVSVWHGLEDSANWSALDLIPEKDPSLVLDGSTGSVYTHTFHGHIHVQPHFENTGFTLRFRTHADASWQWENDIHGTRDGQLIFQSSPAQLQLSDLIELSSSFNVESLRSQSPGVAVWLVNSKQALPIATSGDARLELITFGKIKNQRKFFALIRKSSPWLGPVHGLQSFRLPEDALLCSFLNESGKHVILLALNGVNDMFSLFKSDEHGNIVVAARNDGLESTSTKALIAVADDFLTANAAVMYAARDYVSQTAMLPEVDLKEPIHTQSESVDDDTVMISKDVKAEWLEDWYDGLAYCTWNSLGQDLTEAKIMTALGSLQQAGIKISSLIIDDNWQSLDNPGQNHLKRGWKDFEADSKAFPNGLKHATTLIRKTHPNIQHIAVWHALCGYWGWISPHGKIANNYKTKTVDIDDRFILIETGGKALAVDPDDIHRMYDDFYSFLSASGVDSVKTDVQAALDILTATTDRRRFTTAYQNAWLISINKHFAAKAISCMSQIPQIIFHSLLPKTRPTILFRNSDDFFPDVPDSHPYHIFWNAHMALLVQHLNVLPDWDMFQTSHPYAGFHAAARCISGGPIYITDTPGLHDIALINQMTARNPRGQTIILRPSIIGKTLDIYNDYNERHILRIGSYNGPSKTGVGLIGLFNISDSIKSCLVPLAHFPGVVPSQSYIVRSHIHGTVSSPMALTDQDQSQVQPSNLIFASLPQKGYDILTAYPLQPIPPCTITTTEKNLSIAPLGLLNKFTGAVALVSTTLSILPPSSSSDSSFSSTRQQQAASSPTTACYSSSPPRQRLRINTSLKALGVLGIYISDLATRDVESEFLILMQGRVIPFHTVKKNAANDGVLDIDVEKAWDEMGLSAGWANEVRVEVLMNLE